MRIVGGIWRGRVLKAPQSEGTRPTTDRVRESVASIVMAATGGLEGLSVLDAFAGSGALAFEMLSRGAAHATLLEQDARAFACVKGNAAALGAAPERASVVRGDAFALAQRGRLPGAPFDLVMLDPPYATSEEQVASLVNDLQTHGLLAQEAWILYEHAADSAGIEPEGFEVYNTHRYGITAVDMLRSHGRG